MTLKPNSNPANKPRVRTASLEDRLNTHGRKLLSQAGLESNFITLLQQSDPSIRWPLFSRLLVDTVQSAQSAEWMRKELAALSLGIVDQAQALSTASTTASQASGRIVPLGISEPIDAPKLLKCGAVELQLTGIPFVGTSPKRMHAWTPSFPVEVGSLDQFSKKVELLRIMQDKPSLVGAALAPAVVYDDFRLLADCGFDYVCLLLDVVPDFTSNAPLISLGAIETCLEPALKAIRDSGSKMKLWVASNSPDPIELYAMIQNGVDAVCIDGYLKAMKPAEIEPTRDRYASILSMATPQVSPFAWIKQAVERLGIQLEDLRTYHRI